MIEFYLTHMGKIMLKEENAEIARSIDLAKFEQDFSPEDPEHGEALKDSLYAQMQEWRHASKQKGENTFQRLNCPIIMTNIDHVSIVFYH